MIVKGFYPKCVLSTTAKLSTEPGLYISRSLVDIKKVRWSTPLRREILLLENGAKMTKAKRLINNIGDNRYLEISRFLLHDA